MFKYKIIYFNSSVQENIFWADLDINAIKYGSTFPNPKTLHKQHNNVYKQIKEW